MKYVYTGITFIAHANWWLLPITVAMIIAVGYRWYRFKSSVRSLAGITGALFDRTPVVRASIKLLLHVVAITTLFIALLRPAWHTRQEMQEPEGRDVIIALDISRSMLATDCTPNRLTKAKEKIRELVRILSCERVGLLLFSSSAFMQCPLTKDYEAFLMFLDAVDVETISSGSTACDAALAKAIAVYKQLDAHKTKIVILFTDGEDFSTQLDSIQAAAQEIGLTLFAVGIGTENGAPIALHNAMGNRVGHQKDDQGNIVISRLNEPLLRSITQRLGGMYIPLSSDNTDISTLQAALEQFEKDRYAQQKVTMLQDQYPYLVLITFMALLVDWIVP